MTMTHVHTHTPAHPAELSGRDTGTGISLFLAFLVEVAVLAGGLIWAMSLTGHPVAAWGSPSTLSWALIGAGLVSISPAAVLAARTRLWEDARIVVLPVAIALLGMLGVAVSGASELSGYAGLWVPALALLALLMVAALIGQLREPGLPLEHDDPLPAWTRPPLAVLASAWLGLGAVATFAAHADQVDWTSGPGQALIALVGGLVMLGAVALVVTRGEVTASGDTRRTRLRRS